jgi:hypothetical protein
MHSFYHNCILFSVSSFILVSCNKTTNSTGTKTDTTVTPKADTTIYIAGENGNNPILWKNGIADTLSPTIGSASQVFVSGSDVYVAGIYNGITNPISIVFDLASGQYAYWKNGIQNNIDKFQDISYVPFVSLSGSDVYYANGKGWKNGAMLVFPAVGSPGQNFFPGQVLSTFAVGTDVYFAGTDTSENAVYWKNGNSTIAATYGGRGSTLPHVSCIYVSGSDVYIGGMFNQAVYWKNGTANFLQYLTVGSFVSAINSILVSGNDVYTTGYLIGASTGAAYWKNGIENDLSTAGPPNGNTTYTTTSVFVLGSDVYVAGYSTTFTSPSTLSLDSAVYWKNGVEKSLSTSGRANSIFVQ